MKKKNRKVWAALGKGKGGTGGGKSAEYPLWDA